MNERQMRDIVCGICLELEAANMQIEPNVKYSHLERAYRSLGDLMTAVWKSGRTSGVPYATEAWK
jgi:hypothetical protein